MIVFRLEASCSEVSHDACMKALTLTYMDVVLVEDVNGDINDMLGCVGCVGVEAEVFVWEVSVTC